MRTRAAVAVLFVLAILTTAARTVPDVIDRPLVPDAAGTRQANPLPVTSTDGATVRRGVTLHAPDAAALAALDEVWLVVGTYDTGPVLESATLTVAGTCVFRADARRMEDNTTLRFRREARCDGVTPAPADVVLALGFTAASPRDARAAIWMSIEPEGTPLLFGDIDGRRAGLLGRAIATRAPVRISRARLLAFMWELPVWGVWLFLTAGCGLVVAGGVLLGQRSRGAAGFASFALASGLALVYAVMVPPLQAPDEPDHLLSFAALTERPALADATAAWARRIHFDRLVFKPDERFTPADRDLPYARAWDPADVFAENVRHRSSATTRFWQLLAPLARGTPAHTLLVVRAADALAFGAAFAAGTALLLMVDFAAAPALLAAVILCVPTLPFFGMHMSELVPTIVAFVIAGYGAVLILDGGPGRLTGPILGLAVALIAAGPRSGWPSLVTVAALAAGRALRGPSAPGWRDTIWFWCGVAAPALVLFMTGVLWIPSPFYEQWHLTGFDPRTGISSASFVVGLTLASGVGAVLEQVILRAGSLVRVVGQLARGLAAVAAIGILGLLVASVWVPLPQLRTVEVLPPESAAAYVRSVLVTLATWPRLRGFDFLTWTSLWGGFGWADTILPAAAIAIVTALAGVAAVATLTGAARDAARATIILSGGAGLAASAAVAALSSFGLHRNVHGRYLLGACLIALCLLVAPVVLGPERRLSASTRATALLALCCGLHAYALSFLVGRYFG